jgi:hypothetical protein
MNRRTPSSAAHTHQSQHLLEGDQRRRRRRTVQRCSAVVATLFLGTSQCDAPETSSSGHAPAPAAPVAALSSAPTPTTAPTVTTTAPQAAPATPATPATALERVVVAGPEGTEVQGRCTQYEDLLMIHAPDIGWDVLRMSRLAWRESNCWAGIRSRTSDSGLLQINDISLTFLNEALGEQVDPFTLMNPVQNVRAAAALCTFWARNGASCYQPWTRN